MVTYITRFIIVLIYTYQQMNCNAFLKKNLAIICQALFQIIFIH